MPMYNDNPFITQPENLRTSVSMSIPDSFKFVESGEICESQIRGKFAIGSFKISAKEYEEAWNTMYPEYLFKEDVTPRDAIPFELYVDEPPRNMKDSSNTDIYIPVQ